MRILHVIPYLTPRRGGSVTVVRNLTKELARRGHNVTVITSDFEFDAKFSKEMQNDGVKVIPFRCRMNIGMLLFTPDMKKWLTDNSMEFDLVHLHNFRSYQSNIVCEVSRKTGIPYLLQAHGSVPTITKKVFLKGLYDMAWGRRILRNASLLVSVANVESNQYHSVGIDPDKIDIIPNGLETERFLNLPRKRDFRKKYAIEDRKIVLYLGRIEKVKRIETLVRSFGILAEAIQDAVLVIVGPDEGYRADLEKLVRTLRLEKRVVFTGYVENPGEAYQAADLLVNPNPDEIFGLAPLEAVLCGTPIVVSEHSGSGEIVKKAECGYAIDTNDVERIADTIAHVLRNPAEGKVLVARGREYIASNLDWSEIARRFEMAYRKCIRAK